MQLFLQFVDAASFLLQLIMQSAQLLLNFCSHLRHARLPRGILFLLLHAQPFRCFRDELLLWEYVDLHFGWFNCFALLNRPILLLGANIDASQLHIHLLLEYLHLTVDTLFQFVLHSEHPVELLADESEVMLEVGLQQGQLQDIAGHQLRCYGRHNNTSTMEYSIALVIVLSRNKSQLYVSPA